MMKKHKPPQPYVQAFVVCREIFEDHHTGEYLLFAPRSAFRLAEFPGLIRFAVYAHLTELQGKYRLELQFEDSQGETLWAVRADPPVKHEDPLMPHRFAFRDLKVRVAAQGRYDLVLVSEEIEIARHPLWVLLEEPSGEETERENGCSIRCDAESPSSSLWICGRRI
jgi:hypothetical protein